MSINSPQRQQVHLAIIPDGNRRWARRLRLRPWQGHKRAMENSRQLVSWCLESPTVDVMTFWAFSTENWNRSTAEVKQLMRIFEEYLVGEREWFLKHDVRFVHSGRLDRIPRSLAHVIHEVTQQTNHSTTFTLHCALDYGGKDELLRAIGRSGKKLPTTEKELRNLLDHPELPDIDLIIRTSGEQRISNFFLWQGAYAELYFTPKLFPDLEPADLAQAVEDYQTRQRRFGH